jgi:hypothetical protein
MERGFYNEDIEELLKQKADQYRMYPSDKVWKGIQRSLHPSRKWYWLGFMLFLSAIGYYAFVELFIPGTSKPLSQNNTSSSSPIPQPANDQTTAKAVIVPFGNAQKQGSHTGNHTEHRSFVLNPVPFTNEPINTSAAVTANNNTLAFTTEAPVFDLTTRRIIHDIRALPENNLTLINSQEGNEQVIDANASSVSKAALDQAIQALVPELATPANGTKLNDKTVEQGDGQRINWLHEMAVYELQTQKPKRLSWQIAFTPTMNYRKLTSNNRYNTAPDAKNLPIAGRVEGNPDDLVTHKPALGFEFGSHMMYAANKTFTFRAGVQFNYSRYDIQAYSSVETEKATIALNSSTGLPTGDALTSYTNIRNFGGEEVENLRNQYFQLSMPIGLEVNLLGSNKLQVGVAGTLQPTYLMNRNTYLITTDYKNYTKEPSLVRRVNLHTSAEAFVAYKTGDLKWQVGPQFRYQLLSSYIREYPIREQLMEFGIKIGVAKTIR